MNKLLKWVLAGVGIVVVLMVVAAVVLPMTVDPNNYKDEISAAVLEDTGRELTIGGEIKWTVFPSIGLGLSEVTLGNRSGFGDEPMLDIGDAGVSVKLIPLFSKKVELGVVKLTDVTINLRRKANGQSNWEDLSDAQSSEETTSQGESGGMDALVVSGIEISNANVSLDDAGEITEFKNFELKASNIKFGQPFDLKGGFSMNLPGQQLAGDVNFGGRVQSAANGTRFGIEGFELAFKGTRGPMGESKELDLTVNADADIDLTNDKATLSNFVLRLDESTFKGNLELDNFDRPKLAFDFQVDKLNLDDYLPEVETGTVPDSTPGTVETDLSVEVFRGFTGGGDFRIDELVVGGLTATDVSMKMSSNGNGVSFSPVNALFYGGQHKGKIRIDASGNRPILTADHGLTGVQAEDFLEALTGTARLQGTGDFSLKIRTDISNSNSTLQVLSGDIRLSVLDGAIVGIDVADTLSAVKSALGKQNDLVEESDQAKKTEFAELAMSGVIDKGILSSNDLLMLSPLLKATGEGTLNFVDESIDYVLKPVLLDTAQGQDMGKLSGMAIPIRLRGNLYEPDISVDIVAAIAGSQKELINQKKDELIGKFLGGKDDSDADNTEDAAGEKADPASSLFKSLLGGKKKDKEKDDGGGR